MSARSHSDPWWTERCATCRFAGVLMEKPAGETEHVRGAWPILICALGHMSWWRDGAWHASLRLVDSMVLPGEFDAKP